MVTPGMGCPRLTKAWNLKSAFTAEVDSRWPRKAFSTNRVSVSPDSADLIFAARRILSSRLSVVFICKSVLFEPDFWQLRAWGLSADAPCCARSKKSPFCAPLAKQAEGQPGPDRRCETSGWGRATRAKASWRLPDRIRGTCSGPRQQSSRADVPDQDTLHVFDGCPLWKDTRGAGLGAMWMSGAAMSRPNPSGGVRPPASVPEEISTVASPDTPGKVRPLGVPGFSWPTESRFALRAMADQGWRCAQCKPTTIATWCRTLARASTHPCGLLLHAI